MPRSSWLLVLLAGAALAATGCAQCDTCDDLPLPCPSGDCGMGVMTGPVLAGPAMPAPTIATVPAAPAVIQSRPAASGSNTNTKGTSGSSSTPSPLPPKPGVQAPPFSSGPSGSR